MESAWEIYSTERDGVPAFVMADIGLASFSGKDAYSEVIRCRIPIKELGGNRFPTGAALDCVHEFEETAESIAETGGTAIYAGRFGVGSTVTLIFYAENSEALIEAFSNSEELRKLPSYECEWKHDPEWSQYFALLYPSPEIWNSLNNKRVLDALKNDGDDGLAAREIDHWAYFESEASAHRFAQRVIERNFSLVDQSIDDDNRWRVQFSRDDRPSEIDGITWNLKQMSVELGGDYDGWECGVVRRDDH